MSIKQIHINESKTKEYIIPTNEWLKSIGFNYSLFDQGNVVVKITKNGNYNKMKTINKNVKSNPNMLHTFETIQCSELENIEIMKLYQGSLNDYLNKLNLFEIENLLKQILLCQLHIYSKIGFLHNDIHLGNILVKIIDESKEPETIIYRIKNRKYMIKTYFKLILTDFDKSIIYDQNILPLEKYNNEYTIHYNIVKTINVFKNLLNKLDQQILSESLEKSLKVFSFDFMNSSEKLLRSYYKNNRDLNDFIEISTMECIVMLNDLWMSLYNKNLFPAHAL
jgi:hypothetical protein